MISLDSMGISQVQSTLNLVKSQIATYQGMLTSYRVAYNNATTKIADARQMLNTAKSSIPSVPNNIPLPASLFGKPATNTAVSSSTLDAISLQSLKNKAEDKIIDLEDKVAELESWQAKLEKKLEDLNKQASEYKDQAVSYVKQTAVSVASTVVSGAQTLVTGAISKGQKKATITTDTVQDNELIKQTVAKKSSLTNIS